jgi:hypothetical protein
VPVPYGRTVPLTAPLLASPSLAEVARLVPYWQEKQRNVLAAALITNCAIPRRMDYLRSLQRYIRLNFYGGCTRRWGKYKE